MSFMNEVTPRQMIDELIRLGNNIIKLTKKTYIFRSSCAYNAQHVYSFINSIKAKKINYKDDNQVQALQQLKDLFSHLCTILPLLGQDKWLQPTLNWPTQYVHDYIDKFRENVMKIGEILELPEDSIKFDPAQDNVNKIADFTTLQNYLKGIITEVNFSDLVGVQQQIETKLCDIKHILPKNHSRRNANRRPSGADLPVIKMKKKIEELLCKFKSINIENDDLCLDKQIGAGGFGTVYKATRLSTSEVVAVKELNSDKLSLSSWVSLYAEVETMASVNHPFVLELVGAHITEPFRIITKYCPGNSLFDKIHRSGGLTPTRLTIIAYQIAVGMEHLHSMNIVHRDLKTQNILLDDNDDSCVADFGLSGIMKDNQELCGGLGTPHYTAPEVFLQSTYGPKIDVFSYAVILWEMLMKEVPYADMSFNEIYEHVVTRCWRLPIPNETQEGLKKLITKSWSKNPNERPSFSEIVKMFENGEIYFPNSDKIDFLKIKSAKRSPQIDIDFAISTLKNPNSPHFSSVAYYICSKIDKKIKRKLKHENIIKELLELNKNVDVVLLLASVLLTSKEYNWFLSNGGIDTFRTCLSDIKTYNLSSALKFALKVPTTELNKFKEFIPLIVNHFNDGIDITNSLSLIFLTHFPADDIVEFKKEIAQASLDSVEKVIDQETFNAIVYFLPLFSDCITPIQMLKFRRLLEYDFVVPSSFVISLIRASDKDNHKDLVISILKATSKSDIITVFLNFLQQLYYNEKETFNKIIEQSGLLNIIYNLIQEGSIQAPLFLLFCVSSIEDFAINISKDKLLLLIIKMKGFQAERLQILTSLSMHAKFCKSTTYMDEIINLLVSSLSNKSLVSYAARLIGAFSTHSCGCKILINNGVLEIFTQLYLSSSSGDTSISQAIIKNVARNGCDVPQCSLIVSCLIQDLIYDVTRKAQILDTIIAIVEQIPTSIQEHDLQFTILPHLASEDPLLVQLSLKLFSVCDASILRNIYQQLLVSIYNLIQKKEMRYIEIIEECVNVLIVLKKQDYTKIFIQETKFEKFVQKVVAKDEDKKRKENITYLVSTLLEN